MVAHPLFAPAPLPINNDQSLTADQPLTRKRQASQVTGGSLCILISGGYDEYLSEVDEHEKVKSFHEWKEEKARKYSQFLSWAGVLDLQQCCLKLPDKP